MCPRPPVVRFSCPPPRPPNRTCLVETAGTTSVYRRPLRRKTPIHVGALSQRIGVALSPSARGPNKQGSSPPQERRARKADAKVKARTEVSCHLQGRMQQLSKCTSINFSGRHSRFSKPSTVEKSITALCACPSRPLCFLVETGVGPVGFYALPPRESGIDADKSKQDSGADDDPYP